MPTFLIQGAYRYCNSRFEDTSVSHFGPGATMAIGVENAALKALWAIRDECGFCLMHEEDVAEYSDRGVTEDGIYTFADGQYSLVIGMTQVVKHLEKHGNWSPPSWLPKITIEQIADPRTLE